MPWKILNIGVSGDTKHYGPDDIDKINKYLYGYDLSVTDPVTIATQTSYRSAKLQIRDPANTRSIIIAATDGMAADRTITIPALSSDQGLVTTTATQTLTGKTMDYLSNTFLNFPGGGGGDMVLANVQTITGAKTFNDTKLLLRNPADTFSVTLAAGAQTAARTFTFPVTASDTIVTLGASQTLTGKTLTSPTINTATVNSPTINTPTVVGSGGTLTLPAGPDTLIGLATADTITGVKTFKDSTIKLRNAADTFTGTFTGTFTADRTWTMPNSTGTLVTSAGTATLSSKTMDGGSNTFTNIPKTAIPSATLYNDVDNALGIHYLAFTKMTAPGNPSAGDVRLYVDTSDEHTKLRHSDGTIKDLEASGAGEANTASNVGTAGVGTFKVKSGVDLQFKKIRAASARLSVVDNTGNDTVDIDASTTSLQNTIYVDPTVPADGVTYFNTLDAAITYLNGQPGTTAFDVAISVGDFTTNSGWNLTRGNIKFRGAGMGLTNLIGGSSLADGTPIFQIAPNNSGNFYSLTANATKGALTVTMSTANSANFAVGNYVLLSNNVDIDPDNPGRKSGELHQVTAVNTGTGVITFEGTIFENYTTATSAILQKLVTYYENVHFVDLTFKSAKSSNSALTAGQNRFQFIRNLTFTRCQFKNLFWAGCQIWQVWEGKFASCDFRDISTTSGGTSAYGLSIRGATRGIDCVGMSGSTNRHSVSMGSGGATSGSEEFRGRFRNVNVVGGHFEHTTTAHLDCHYGGDGIMFNDNVMIGDDSSSNAMQFRSPGIAANNVIVGINGRGIYCYKGGSNVQCVGNWIEGCTYGIQFDNGTINNTAVGNYIFNCTTVGILLQYDAPTTTRGGDHSAIVDNYLYNNVKGISVDSAQYLKISGNVIDSHTGRAIEVNNSDSASSNISITNNDIYNNGTDFPVITGTVTNLKINNNNGANVKTENSGSGTITSGNTTVTVSHGLGYTPAIADIMLTRQNSPTNSVTSVWASGITSTQFVINCNTNPGTSGLTVSWMVRRVN